MNTLADKQATNATIAGTKCSSAAARSLTPSKGSAADLQTDPSAFTLALTAKMNANLPDLDGKFTPINYPLGLHYIYTGIDDNNDFNALAFEDIDQMLGDAGNGTLKLLPESFSQTWINLLNAVAYVVSAADNKTIQTAQDNAAAEISSTIKAYESDFGTITTAQITAAKAVPPTKLGYVQNQVQVLFGGDITKAPTSLNTFKIAYQSFQVAAGAGFAILQRAAQAQVELASALANTTTPSAANGGLPTQNGTTVPAYKVPSQVTINSGLQTLSNDVTLQTSFSSFSSTTVQGQVQGGGSLSVPLGDFFDVQVNAQASFDWSSALRSSSTATMTMTWSGLTLIAASPAPLAGFQAGSSSGTGWYDLALLTEAINNLGAAPNTVTGFQLMGSEFPAAFFGPGGKFCRLATAVVSQMPTIAITFTNVDTSTMSSYFQESSSATVSVLGLFNIGGGSQSYQVAKCDTSGAAGTVTISFGPVNLVGTQATADETAYLIGGVVDFPA
ncbi:hypothetical protein WME94_05795 [Sorangium sp. So ce429]